MGKISAVIGYAIYNVIAKKLPPSNAMINVGQKALRRWCVSQFAEHVSKDANIESGANISRRIHVGKKSGIGIDAFIQGQTYIGDYVMMGPGCNIWTVNHQSASTDIPMCEQGVKEEQPVFIGNDVWIGSRVTILPGVRIGDGAIIGAGCVVAQDIPPYAVAIGNPAQVIRIRGKDNSNNGKEM